MANLVSVIELLPLFFKVNFACFPSASSSNQALETSLLQSFAGFDSTARSLFAAHIRSAMSVGATSTDAHIASASPLSSPSTLPPSSGSRREVGATIQLSVVPTSSAVRAAGAAGARAYTGAADAALTVNALAVESAIASGSAPECRGFSSSGAGGGIEMARPWQADTPALLLDDDDDDLD